MLKHNYSRLAWPGHICGGLTSKAAFDGWKCAQAGN